MNRGFTLLEILITICIVTALLGVIIYLGFDIIGFNSFISENIISQNELQLSLNSMITEIRSMGPSSVGSYPIETANLNSLTFYSDTDKDGLFERIRYYYNGTTLMRGSIKPSGSPLAYNPANEKTNEVIHFVISNPADTFVYYGKDATSSSAPLVTPINPSQVRSIKTTIIADRDPKAEPGPVIFSVFATIRNLRNAQ